MEEKYGMMKCFPDSFDHRDNIGFVGKMGDPKQPLQLLKSNYNGGSCHETNSGSVGEKINKEAQPVYYFKVSEAM